MLQNKALYTDQIKKVEHVYILANCNAYDGPHKLDADVNI